MPVRVVPALALVSIAVAGCLRAPEEPGVGADGRGPGLVPPTGFTYDCPPGETFRRTPDVCAASVVDRENGLNEPYLVIHPANPLVMTLAAHSVPTRRAVAAGEDGGSGAILVENAVYVTEDGGATWRRSNLPRVALPSQFGPVDARLYYDPAIAIDTDGVLHVVGIASNDLGAAGFGAWGAENAPYYTRSTDSGAAWSAPVVLDEAFTDRPFVAVEPGGRIVVDWIRYEDQGRLGMVIAWSDDAGASWTTIEDTGCVGFSPPRVIGGSAHVACVAAGDTGPTAARFARLEGDALVDVGTIGELPGYRARLGVVPGGGVTVANEARDVLVAFSADGGATWAPPVDELASMTLDDGFGGRFVKWFGADPWGALHLVLGLSDNDLCAGGSRGPPGTCRVVHAAFDPLSGALIQESVLSEADGASAYRVPGTLAPPTEARIGDDFYAFDFAADHGVLLWTRDAAIDFTLVRPVPAPRP